MWGGQLIKTARGRVFASCSDNSRVVVTSLEDSRTPDVSPDQGLLLVEFVRSEAITSGFIGGSNIFVRRC